MSPTLELTKHLIRQPSITPDDAGCQDIISDRLKAMDFHIENMRFGQVDNLWARHGTQSPLVVFAGHTDVVPPGPLDAWLSDPFQPVVRDSFLYGRGAADMKGGIAAMIVAVENFIQKNRDYAGSIAFLITSDEEGATNLNGTRKVVEALQKRNEKIDYCIIGEASSEKLIGDQVRVGRRGSLAGKLTIHGKQGHVAFPHLAQNPIHMITPAIQEIITETWDNGNEFFPPTTFQISNIHSGTGASNVIPGKLDMVFNFRFSTAITPDELKRRMENCLSKHQLKFDIQWNLSGEPFLTKQGKLIATVKKTIKELTGLDTKLSTGGGTSDGRFIAPTGAEVVELGPCHASAHHANEHVRVMDLEKLTEIYQLTLERLFL